MVFNRVPKMLLTGAQIYKTILKHCPIHAISQTLSKRLRGSFKETASNSTNVKRKKKQMHADCKHCRPATAPTALVRTINSAGVVSRKTRCCTLGTSCDPTWLQESNEKLFPKNLAHISSAQRPSHQICKKGPRLTCLDITEKAFPNLHLD